MRARGRVRTKTEKIDWKKSFPMDGKDLYKKVQFIPTGKF